jgi:hypothetical protein
MDRIVASTLIVISVALLHTSYAAYAKEGAAWSNRRFVPNMPSPLIVDDPLFMVSDRGARKDYEE